MCKDVAGHANLTSPFYLGFGKTLFLIRCCVFIEASYKLSKLTEGENSKEKLFE